jgi:hypothetical protein
MNTPAHVQSFLVAHRVAQSSLCRLGRLVDRQLCVLVGLMELVSLAQSLFVLFIVLSNAGFALLSCVPLPTCVATASGAPTLVQSFLVAHRLAQLSLCHLGQLVDRGLRVLVGLLVCVPLAQSTLCPLRRLVERGLCTLVVRPTPSRVATESGASGSCSIISCCPSSCPIKSLSSW